MSETKLSPQLTELSVEDHLSLLQDQIAELKARLAHYEFELEEGTSAIEGAGTGLFTNSFIPSGCVVGEYSGTRSYRLLVPATGRYVMWQKDAQGKPRFLTEDTYILWLVDEDEDDRPWMGDYPEVETGIDGGVSGNVMRYANSDDEPNLEMFVTEDKRVMAISVREIEADKELFWDYHPGRDKDFSVTPDHIETELQRFITVTDKGWVRLTEQALQIPQKRGGKKNKKRRKKRRG